jgi:hypothetical protein
MGDYNLGGDDFPQYSPRPSQPLILCVPLRVPPRLRITMLNMKLQ